MGKKNNAKEEPKKKSHGHQTTLARKARKVLQSNGLQYFLQWADTPTTGGRRKKSMRSRMKLELPKLYKELVAQGEASDRKMDKPKPKD